MLASCLVADKLSTGFITCSAYHIRCLGACRRSIRAMSLIHSQSSVHVGGFLTVNFNLWNFFLPTKECILHILIASRASQQRSFLAVARLLSVSACISEHASTHTIMIAIIRNGTEPRTVETAGAAGITHGPRAC